MLPSSRPFNQHYCYSSSSNSASSDSDIAAESASAVSYGLGMDSIQLPVASVEVLRCMRCARSVEATSTDDIIAMGMVRIAHNLYYCERCAKMHRPDWLKIAALRRPMASGARLPLTLRGPHEVEVPLAGIAAIGLGEPVSRHDSDKTTR
ncbi:hypothetical protein QL093DRAFT_2579668 [Fusarium oxysporum]|nr:hypothetical protein QL093DRAFT_2579668 [Fusarium oxysporum]